MRLGLFLLFVPILAQSKTIQISDVPWLEKVRQAGIAKLNVCGTAQITLTKKSLRNHFAPSIHPRGFFLTDLIEHSKYWEILAKQNLAEAKTSIENEFKKTHLWSYTREEGLKDLGAPSQITMPFTATVKDCVEGAQKTLGGTCSDPDPKARLGCCREKFVGPRAQWGQHELMYSPDPSVRLKVAGEKKHRYCQITEPVELGK